MKTDDLIAALARDAEPVSRALVWRRVSAAALGAFGLATVVAIALFGAREDLASFPAAAGLKAALVLVLLAASAWFAWRAARPATRLAGALRPALALLGVSLLAALVVLALTPEGARLAALLPTGVAPPCLTAIPITAAPGAVLVFWAVRSLGPTRAAHAGAAAGAVAGGLGALAYCLHCPIDSAAYVLAWYPIAITACAGVGALIGPRVLRW